MVNSPHFVKTGNPQIFAEQLGSGGSAALTGSGGSYHESAVQSPLADHTTGSFFCWLNFGAGSGGSALQSIIRLEGSGTGFINLYTDDAPTVDFTVQMNDTTGAQLGRIHSGANGITPGTWTALFASWDSSTFTTTNVFHMYFQPLDAAASDVITIIATAAGTIDCDGTGSTAHRCFGNSTTQNWTDTAISQLWLSDSTQFDFSVAANRELFVTAAGRPRNLGPDGALTSGVTPTIWWPQGFPSNGFVLAAGSQPTLTPGPEAS